MERYLKHAVLEDLEAKMVFVGGARQVGKTTLAVKLAPKNHRYLNWDSLKDKEAILKQHFPLEKFIIFDEIHKFSNWRNYLKSLYDSYKAEKKILVTGSARLDYYRHGGDSLQGRYHYYRLHPFTVKELSLKTTKDINSLLILGGFPEPFLSGSERTASRWRREYNSRVINEDITSLQFSQKLSQMELLLLRLPLLVGNPLSVNSLREDLNLAHKTVQKYLDIFERMYLIYRISPFSSHKLRAVKKEQKHYHYNWAEIKDPGARFENLIASHLLKWIHFKQDYEGKNMELYYFRDTDKREVDFIITEDNKPLQAIECKINSKEISPHLKYFKAKFPEIKCVQVHLSANKEYLSKEDIHFLSCHTFLKDFI